ncbi:flavodoxin family protein [Planococcus beijingensis]|uniref:flavodoxin family protein n=1 Tax=Planococcus beijingensis TaxID=2782551 RepID=UPI00193B9A93|nr:flavodoxin family protein [Planococcus beijingensis]
MKSLIVYYSHSGNNEKLAIELRDRIGCDMYEIKEKKKRKDLAILMDFLVKRNSRLAPLDFDVSDYGPIILLAPVWAGKVAAPMRTFIQMEKDKLTDYSFITLCSGAAGQREKIAAELSALTPQKPTAVAELWINNLLPEEQRNKIKYATNFRVEKQHLQQFNEEIQFFIEMALHTRKEKVLL